MKELREELKRVREKFEEVVYSLGLEEKQKRFATLEADVADPAFWNNSQKAKEVSKERDELKTFLEGVDRERKKISDVETILELLEEEGEGSELVTEAEQKLSEVVRASEAMEFRRMLSGE